MSWKKFTTDYLSFSRKDRVGIIALLLLIAAIISLPHFFGHTSSISIDSTGFTSAVEKLDTREVNKKNYDDLPGGNYRESSGPPPTAELFRFDPNELSVEGWQRLGLNEKTSRTIERYRSKGGVFHKPEDLKKIWGLPKGFYERVSPFIEIKKISSAIPFAESPTVKFSQSFSIIELNSADTTTLISLPGIGTKLATRIISFRDKLGGFYSVDQLKETYGLQDSVFRKIKPRLTVNETKVKKIHLNEVNLPELAQHPYFKSGLAKQVIAYREQHGAFKDVDDLRRIQAVDEAVLGRILPYIDWK